MKQRRAIFTAKTQRTQRLFLQKITKVMISLGQEDLKRDKAIPAEQMIRELNEMIDKDFTR